jgi:hypothetical protein
MHTPFTIADAPPSSVITLNNLNEYNFSLSYENVLDGDFTKCYVRKFEPKIINYESWKCSCKVKYYSNCGQMSVLTRQMPIEQQSDHSGTVFRLPVNLM